MLLRVRPSGFCSRLRWISTRPTFNKDAAFALTQPPSPDWKYGEGLPTSQKAWREQGDEPRSTWDLTTMTSKSVLSRAFVLTANGILNAREIYPLLTSAIIPRPIALVSSLSPDGKQNLAPFRCVACKVGLIKHNSRMHQLFLHGMHMSV
jgi:hypothetical protein